MSYSLQFLSDLDAAERFLGPMHSSTSGIYGSLQWWRAVELMRPEVETLYFSICDSEGARCVLPAYLYRSGRSGEPYACDWMAPRDRWPAIAHSEPWALLGGCSGLLTGFSYTGDKEPSRLFANAIALASANLREAGLNVVAKFFGEQERRALAERLEMPVSRLPLVGVNAKISPLSTSMDCFLEGLPSTFRGTVRRDRKNFLASGVNVRTENLSEVIDELASLWDMVEVRHGASPNVELRRHMLSAQARALNSCSCVYSCRDADGRPLAMSLNYLSSDSMSCRLVGIDYERAAASRSYFQAMYYEPIIQSQRHGKKTLYLGPSAMRAKVTRGATLIPMFGYYLGRTGEQIAATTAEAITTAVVSPIREELQEISGKAYLRPAFLRSDAPN